MEDVQPRPDWSREKQPNPPNFGQARLIPMWLLDLVVWCRRLKTLRVLSREETICEFDRGKVSLIVLSCKRFPQFQRLCETLVPFFGSVEDYPALEKILVDNGSGSELTSYANNLGFFDEIVAHPHNLGMAQALNDAYRRCRGEFIMLVEDDMIVDYDRPFLRRCLEVLQEYPEIGLVRLKNQNNWWKSSRIIGPLRATSTGVDFWTWLPSLDRVHNNVWACGSVLLRKVSFMDAGLLPLGEGRYQATLVENVYAKRYNRKWLAAKIKDCYPIFQPNDNAESPGFKDRIL